MSLKNRLIPCLSVIVLFLNAADAVAETMCPSPSATIAATATVVVPVGLTEVEPDILPDFLDDGWPLEPFDVTAGIDNAYGLFYNPGGKALLQIEVDGVMVEQVSVHDPAGTRAGLLVTNSSIPDVSLVSMEALARSLPQGASSCQVTIIYSEN